MLAALAASGAWGGTVFEGPVVADAVASSIEINDSLHQVLQAQARYDRGLSFVTSTVRWAPGKFELADGQLVAGNLARYIVGGGASGGTVTKFAGFGGLLMDGIGETGAQGMGYGGYQEILYGGVAIKGFQVALNARIDFLGGGANLTDPWHQFEAHDAVETYRRALPFDDSAIATHGKTWTLYHGATGAFAYVTYDEGMVYDARLHLQPLARVLPPLWGLPAAGLRYLDERAEEAFPHDDVVVPDAFADLQPPEKRYQADLGTDDALGIGLRTRIVFEVVPTRQFRYAEVGMVKSLGEIPDLPVGFGFRAALGRPDATLRFAAESFAMLGYGKSETTSTGHKGHVALSYSYSVPDATTYIPIPNAHVFGLQFVLGPPEASKPIVPLVRGLDAHP